MPQEIKKAPSLIDEASIKIKEPKVQGLEVPGRPGSSISLPYIRASVKSPMEIGRQSLEEVSKKYAESVSPSSVILKTSSSNLKNLTSIQLYGSTLKKARQTEAIVASLAIFVFADAFISEIVQNYFSLAGIRHNIRFHFFELLIF